MQKPNLDKICSTNFRVSNEGKINLHANISTVNKFNYVALKLISSMKGLHSLSSRLDTSNVGVTYIKRK